MKYRNLGKTGMNISEIGFGAWAIGGSWGKQRETDSVEALRAAIDQGVNFIDTAAGYGDGKSERIIAEVLRNRKEDVFVTTKTPPVSGPWPPTPYCDIDERYPEKYIRENVEERMKNLGTETIDVLLLHTWTRAWNRNPKALEVLGEMKSEGKIRAVGISTPEHDQNCAIELIRDGLVDVVEVIYNIFEQEPMAELFPVAHEHGTGIIVRVALDEGVLSGKYKAGDSFPEDDFRHLYFAGDRLARAVQRVSGIREEIASTSYSLPEVALKFALAPEAVSTVIPGMRNKEQAVMNTDVSELEDLPADLLLRLRDHAWRRGLWYAGK
ncbi:MAG TPA: aldo/keto reductase [Bacteroidales bacterium]|nr:aldo/keto reductase [Bacteroidales bacterium]